MRAAHCEAGASARILNGVTDPLAAHAAQFRMQAVWAASLGSPFTACLLIGLSEDIGTGGPLDRLLAPIPGTGASNASLRLTGALHALVLEGRDAELAARYPSAQPFWDPFQVRDVARAALSRHEDWIAGFLRTAPQTNEVRRAIGLIAGFDGLTGPFHLLEVGASGGLNQFIGDFEYRTPAWSRAGVPDAPVIDTHWTGAPPELDARFEVAGWAGCDLAPIDIRNDTARKRLRAYIWPDQPERLARLDGALALAGSGWQAPEQADAADWLEARLAGELPEGTTVVFHSIAWHYFSTETAERASAAIEAAGARADAGHRLAWIRMEHDTVFGAPGRGYRIDRRTWPSDAHAFIARVDPHLRWLERA